MSNGTFNSVGPVLFEEVTKTTLTLGVNSPELGTVLCRNGAEYIYVYNAGGASITAGECAIISGCTGYSVTNSSITALNCFAIGVAVATFATAAYGWLLTRGFATAEIANTINVIGTPLQVGNDGLFQTGVAQTTTTSPEKIVGTLVQTSTGGSGYAYFKF